MNGSPRGRTVQTRNGRIPPGVSFRLAEHARRTAPSPACRKRPFTAQADGGSLCPWTSALFPREFGFDTETSRCVFVSSRGGGVRWGFLSNGSDADADSYADADADSYADSYAGPCGWVAHGGRQQPGGRRDVHPVDHGAERRGRRCSGDDTALLPVDRRDDYDGRYGRGLGRGGRNSARRGTRVHRCN